MHMKSWFAALPLALSMSAAHSRDLVNADFDVVGDLGAAVTHLGTAAGPTAAAGWTLLPSTGGGFAITALSASTDPLPGGGGNMLTLYASAAGAELFQSFAPPPAGGSAQDMAGSAAIDVFLGIGQSAKVFFTDALGQPDPLPGIVSFSGTGQWERIVVGGLSPSVDGFGLMLTSAASTVLVDHAVISAVPDAPATMLAPFGLLVMTAMRRRSRSALVAASSRNKSEPPA